MKLKKKRKISRLIIHNPPPSCWSMWIYSSANYYEKNLYLPVYNFCFFNFFLFRPDPRHYNNNRADTVNYIVEYINANNHIDKL